MNEALMDIDYLLTNAIVLTMDEKFHEYEPGAVAIQGSKIIDVGSSEQLESTYTAVHVIDCGGKVLLPGLINTHTHAPMTLMRGLANDLRLDVWLLGYMMPVERELVSPDFVRLGTLIACAEMIRSGITCFADMYYFEEVIAETIAQVGMRAVCSETVLKFPTPDAHTYEESLAYSRNFIQRWKGHDLITPSVGPHAPYTCNPEILRACAALAVEFDVPLHIHLAETQAEVENMRNEQGMPVIPYIKKQNVLEAKVIAAHCVHVDEGEIRTLLHSGAGVAHNPSSNLKLASGIAPVKKMVELGLNVGIGTDGAASNNDLDMFEEIRLATFLAKGASGDPTALPARTVLALATRQGAKAIHLGKITGSIEVGKRADLIILDNTSVHSVPRFRHDREGLYSQIVYTGKASDVTDVMVNGQWLMRHQQLLTINEAELLVQAQEYARRIDTFLINREKSVLSKLVAIGGAAEEESFEVQVKVRIQDVEPVLSALKNDQIEILRVRHYHQYDTYFGFNLEGQGWLRYREDEFVDENGQVSNVRSRLTLIGPARERSFPHEVILSRSRFIAPATHSLRFYKEYFQPSNEVEVIKDRQRYLVNFRGAEFYINIDHVSRPDLGLFLEIKSTTWSLQDANLKAKYITDLLALLGVAFQEAVPQDYIVMVTQKL
jgi:5-methylthioadenosine/S-adenosylhomocysteine deaminase